MKVRATARGYDGVKVREVGEEFDFSGPLGSWMERAEGGNDSPAPVAQAGADSGDKSKGKKADKAAA